MTRIFATIAFLAAATAASAQEPFKWTGLYFGAHLGAAVNADTTYTYTVSGNYEPAGRPRPTDPEGSVYGAQVGYLWQYGPAVFGIEGAAAHATMSGTLKENPPPAGNDYQTRTEAGPLYMVTGRLGFAFDRLLLYGKAGYAWTSYDFEATFHNKDGLGGTNGSVVRISNTFDAEAPVYGGGVEFAFSRNVSVGVEYMRADFGTSDVVTLKTTNSGITTEKLKASHEYDTVTARLNFRF